MNPNFNFKTLNILLTFLHLNGDKLPACGFRGFVPAAYWLGSTSAECHMAAGQAATRRCVSPVLLIQLLLPVEQIEALRISKGIKSETPCNFTPPLSDSSCCCCCSTHHGSDTTGPSPDYQFRSWGRSGTPGKQHTATRSFFYLHSIWN